MEVEYENKSPLIKYTTETLIESSDMNSNKTLNKTSNNTIETLLQINEQTNDKLKVTVRRLSIYESEIQTLKESLQTLQLSKSQLEEQVFLLHEKTISYENAFKNSETQKDVWRIKYERLENKNNELSQENKSLKRYQEKINTKVKPYFEQLKEYSKNLELMNEKLSTKCEHHEVQIQEQRKQMQELIKNFQFQIDTENQKNELLVSQYENEVAMIKKELGVKLENIEILSSQNKKLEDYSQRYFELENRFIELQRNHDNSVKSSEADIANLKKQNYKFDIESQDLKSSISHLEKENQQLKSVNLELEKQLESIKYLWNQKNKENEKLRSAVEAFEKMNFNL